MAPWFYWAPGKGSGLEVALLLQRGRDLIALEVKSSKTVRPSELRGLRAMSELPRLRRRVVVFTGERRQTTEDGIELLPVRDFLREVESGTLMP